MKYNALIVRQRAAMDDVLADINLDNPMAPVDQDVEMADVVPRAVQKQAKQEKDRKKKRKHSDTNGEVTGTKSKKSKK